MSVEGVVYIVLVLLFFVIGYAITDAHLRSKRESRLVVRVKRADGSFRTVVISSDQSPEAAALLEAVRKSKAS